MQKFYPVLLAIRKLKIAKMTDANKQKVTDTHFLNFRQFCGTQKERIFGIALRLMAL